MFQRTINLPKFQSFFLFGARGTGKSTLLRTLFPGAHFVDLLDSQIEAELMVAPHRLEAFITGSQAEHVVIDEIQKIPKLLDEVHRLIERPGQTRHFILTVSSNKKLRAGGANLLAGRAFLRNLFPLSQAELGSDFVLEEALRWGTLPKLYSLGTEDLKRDYLDSYAQLYIKEEVWSEQLVRNLPPFRKFLEVAALHSGKILNAASIARDVGVDPKTVQSYYGILEETFLGFHLDPYHSSVRKRLRQAHKFYFLTPGFPAHWRECSR